MLKWTLFYSKIQQALANDVISVKHAIKEMKSDIMIEVFNHASFGIGPYFTSKQKINSNRI